MYVCVCVCACKCMCVCVCVCLTTVLPVPDLHTVLLHRDAVNAVVWLVPIPVAVLIVTAVCPLQSAFLRTTTVRQQPYVEHSTGI